MVFLAVSTGFSLLATPIYRAETTIAPIEHERGGGLLPLVGQVGAASALTGMGLSGGDSLQLQVAILASRKFTTRLVQEHNLLPALFPDRWDSARGQWGVGADEVPTLWDAYRKFEDIRELRTDVKAGLIRLSIDWPDPERAAEWARLYVDTLNQHLQKQAIDEAERSITYLRDQAEQTSNVEMRQTLYNLIEEQTKKAVLARVRDEFAAEVIDPAMAPDQPIWPKPLIIIPASLVVALLVGVFLAFFLESVQDHRMREASAAGSASPGDAAGS